MTTQMSVNVAPHIFLELLLAKSPEIVQVSPCENRARTISGRFRRASGRHFSPECCGTDLLGQSCAAFFLRERQTEKYPEMSEIG